VKVKIALVLAPTAVTTPASVPSVRTEPVSVLAVRPRLVASTADPARPKVTVPPATVWPPPMTTERAAAIEPPACMLMAVAWRVISACVLANSACIVVRPATPPVKVDEADFSGQGIEAVEQVADVAHGAIDGLQLGLSVVDVADALGQNRLGIAQAIGNRKSRGGRHRS